MSEAGREATTTQDVIGHQHGEEIQAVGSAHHGQPQPDVALVGGVGLTNLAGLGRWHRGQERQPGHIRSNGQGLVRWILNALGQGCKQCIGQGLCLGQAEVSHQCHRHALGPPEARMKGGEVVGCDGLQGGLCGLPTVGMISIHGRPQGTGGQGLRLGEGLPKARHRAVSLARHNRSIVGRVGQLTRGPGDGLVANGGIREKPVSDAHPILRDRFRTLEGQRSHGLAHLFFRPRRPVRNGRQASVGEARRQARQAFQAHGIPAVACIDLDGEVDHGDAARGNEEHLHTLRRSK